MEQTNHPHRHCFFSGHIFLTNLYFYRKTNFEQGGSVVSCTGRKPYNTKAFGVFEVLIYYIFFLCLCFYLYINRFHYNVIKNSKGV